MAKTFVYIDGFNLYYGCFKHPHRQHWANYKWLDLEKLCDSLLPRDDVVAIKYYTADVSNRPPDNHQSDRQQEYLSALSTLARVEIVKGYFLGPEVKRMPQCDADGNYLGQTVTVLRTEEKGSDVNLAVDLLYDAVKDLYECAVVVSNDSDLERAMRIVRHEHHKLLGIVSPRPERPSQQLSKHANFRKRLGERLLASSQLPPEIRTATRVIRKPAQWP
jgi:uncharacterized LabA/DUF88 family protein